MNKRLLRLILVMAGLICVTGCAGKEPDDPEIVAVTTNEPDISGEQTENNTEENRDPIMDVDLSKIKKGANNAKVSVHDPSIDVFEGKYYIYGSHMTAAVSEDLRTWKWIGNGYKSSNKTFGEIFDNARGYEYSGLGTSLIKTDDGGNHVWAPDVIYNEAMGKYCMYYCYSSTWNASNLALAVSDSPEGPFKYVAPLIYSGYDTRYLSRTNILEHVSEEWAKAHYFTTATYNYNSYPNAIDPTVFYDADHKMWMVYGSWSGGIFILEIDEQTGLPIFPEADEENNVDPYYGKRLLGGFHKSIEGPYIHYEEKTGYYYLYVSYGGLTQKGGYQIRVFRSDKPNGDYVDLNGKTALMVGAHYKYGVKLSGNYTLPSINTPYMATGGQSLFTDTDGKTYICYHTRFGSSGEYHEPAVKQVLYNEEGWPCLLPYRPNGETVSESGYEKEKIVGVYSFINMGDKIDAVVSEPILISLNDNGTVSGNATGTWEAKSGTCYMKITVDDVTYSGVFCEQTDMTGVTVMTFTAVGNNTSVWGVKY